LEVQLRKLVTTICCLVSLASCDHKDDPRPMQPIPEVSGTPSSEPHAEFQLVFASDWEKRNWLQKLSKKLRLGSVPSEEEFTKWLEMEPSAVVDELLSQASFADTIFDFNIFYLGFKNDRTARFLNENFGLAANFPSAAVAAREFVQGGDYLRLWEFYQPFMIQPLSKAYLPDQNREEAPENGESRQPEMTQAEIRETIYAKISSQIDSQLARLDAPETNESNICAVLDAGDDQVSLQNAGLSFGLENKISTELFLETSLDCFLTQTTDISKLRTSLIRFRNILPKWFELIDSLAAGNYRPNSISELKEVNLEEMDLPRSTVFSDFNFWLSLQNSSTNLNRRRAAYILRRYFCDDLTPINIAVPKEHTQDRHASDPSCAACHYKLDPMAGFFRNIGIVGIDFVQSDTLVFDDQARISRSDYEKNWSSHADPEKLNIGFIRSLTKLDKNIYATELPELFEIIRSAPEAKRCLVKRLSEYFVDEDQIFDDDYLGHLTNQFVKNENSSSALKQTITSLVTSKTFAQVDPNAQSCYDYAPGVLPSNRPPCQVAAVLKRNCASCHSSTSAAGGLNLENWVVNQYGEKTFQHRREGGDVALRGTLESIIDRLSTIDLDRRMPLNQSIDVNDRDIIFNWAQSMLNDAAQKRGE
jgi:hypothetical protein